jgi:hypothetical protein
VPISPFRKTVILDAGDGYHRGTFTWFPRRFEAAPDVVPKHDRDPAVLRAQEDPRFRAILVWARFPYYELTRDPDGIRVTLADMRFGPRLFNATTIVRQEAVGRFSLTAGESIAGEHCRCRQTRRRIRISAAWRRFDGELVGQARLGNETLAPASNARSFASFAT